MRTLLFIFAISVVTGLAYGQTTNEKNWAVIVGIDHYQSLPGLTGAVKGAKLVAQKLVKDFGFNQENIIELYNDDATRSNILNAFDKLTDQQMISQKDRVFIFFAGHAVTRPVGGKDVGFIMPVDGVVEKLFGTAVSTDQLQAIEGATPAKQVFFCMDACYGGTIFTRGLGLVLPNQGESGTARAYSAKASRTALTAGSKDEEVTDMADQGIDAFTYYLLQGLNGTADVNGDKIVTASELADFVAKSVRYRTTQHPQYGKLPGDEGGEFVFVQSTPPPVAVVPPPSPNPTQAVSNQNPPPQQKPVQNPPQQRPKVVRPPTVIANAPEPSQFWIYAFLGGNGNTYSETLDDAKYGTKAGANLGLGVEYRFTSNFALGLNLFIIDNRSLGGTYTHGYLFSYDGYYNGVYYDQAEILDGTFTDDIEYFSINPLMKLSIGGAYIDLGASIGMVHKSEETGNFDLALTNYSGDYEQVKVSYDDKLTDVKPRIGIPVGIGYDLDLGGFRLSCELRYDFELTATKLYSNLPSGKISSAQLLLGAGFGL